MPRFLRQFIKFLAYVAAGVVIVLAIAVGLFRLFLPRLPEYQEEIEAWASEAIGMDVRFSDMDARWGLSGPELEFYNAELLRPGGDMQVIAAGEVRVGVGLLRLLADRTLVVDRIVIRESLIDVRQTPEDGYLIQGIPADDLLVLRPTDGDLPASVDVIGERLQVSFTPKDSVQAYAFEIPRLRVGVDERRIAANADVRLPDSLGRQIRLSALQVQGDANPQRRWDIAAEAEDLRLPGWAVLLQSDRQLMSGRGDAELSVAYTNGRISQASADIDFSDVGLAENRRLNIAGHVELDLSSDGWLVAANELAIAMPDHRWPQTSLRIEAGTDIDGRVVMLDASANYLNLDDAPYLLPWLTQRQRDVHAQYAPSGALRNVKLTVSDIGTSAARFNVTAALDAVGIASSADRPGVRGFTGLLRANQSGGLLEIGSSGVRIDAPQLLSETIEIDDAEGTVIWRRSKERTTVLSDSIRLSSEILDSHSNVQLTLFDDGSSPEIDLSSTWSIASLARAKRLIPEKIMKPKLYEWFQMALVGGSIPAGTTELNGPLDAFPFDNGEGRLRIEGSVRNLTFKYHRDWPAAEQADLEVVLENARLYSEKNRSVSLGNSVVDASVEIPDLRDPVLHIRSFSTGTLESIRAFSNQSPIARVFGGQLDRVRVSGDASFSLDLEVPLKKDRIREFEFESRVRSNNGSVHVDGFDPPVTDLIGEVTITRNTIATESLGGQFLGQPVNIELERSSDPQYTVLAKAVGTLTGDGVVNGLGIPLEGRVDGRTPYQATILFPSRNVESPPPLTIRFATELDGLEVDLPRPVGKSHQALLAVRGDIRILPGGERIESVGTIDEDIVWQLGFFRPEGPWDLDRGVVTFGDAEGIFDLTAADTRGLHIRGRTEVVRLEDWLSLSRGGGTGPGVADRIRSIDVQIDDLYVLGQHLRDHDVRVDRSARDWLVQIGGEDVTGSLFVPYDFSSGRDMVLDMERLRLPGDDSGAGAAADTDPRSLPPISLTAAEFLLGDRHLGAVEAKAVKTEQGLDVTLIRSEDATFDIAGTGRWIADESDPLGSRSYMTATLTSTDVKETMSRLGYQPGIASDSMTMLFDLDWSGSPRADFFDVLDGNVQVQLENGQLEEVEPGAGRMFGLMSVVALPRRLSLDFRDVFSKGFRFDRIAGSFRIVDGRTYTCDLSLEGPAADIGIVGEADIANRRYAQTAVVSANVGNTLPIVGAIAAGPQAAAALLIFSQIFKKPLQEVGQVYYRIGGSWDEPAIDSADSEAFVASGRLAGCLSESN